MKRQRRIEPDQIDDFFQLRVRVREERTKAAQRHRRRRKFAAQTDDLLKSETGDGRAGLHPLLFDTFGP